MKLSINNIYRLAFTFFIPMIMVNTFLSIFEIDTDILVYYLPMLLVFLKGLSYAFKHNKSTTIKTSTVFLTYLLLSAVLYVNNGTPFSCFLHEILKTIFPLLYVFLGYKYSDDNEFNRWFIYGCTFCFAVGLFFYITTPSFYVHYLAQLRDLNWYSTMPADENTIMETFRFSALFGDSYYVSYLSIPVLALSLSNTVSNKLGVKESFLYLIALFSFISAILCMQRIAIAFAILVPLFYALFSIIKGVGTRLLFIYVIIVIIIVGALGIISSLDRFADIKEGVIDKFLKMNFSDAMSERTGQYTGFKRQTDWSLFIGLGLGSCGGYARAAGLDGVTDGWFVKSYYESGIIGMLLFAYIIIPTLIRCLKNMRLFDSEMMIIVFFLAACLGADALSSTIPPLIFWYCVGRVWNPRYYRNLKEGKLRI